MNPVRKGQCRLAFVYKTVPLDFAKAAFWYRRAAERGHAGTECNFSA